MVGVITTRDILAHPLSIIQSFGWLIFFRAVAPWQGRSFLQLLQESGCFRPSPSSLTSIFQRCIDLELRAQRIYRVLARALEDEGVVSLFFANLAEQEQHHADLLQLVQAAAARNGWKARLFDPWHDYLPRLEQQMEASEAAVYRIDSVEAALRLVVEIESSEINQVFDALITATDAACVRRLSVFRESMEAHIGYIVDRLPVLAPELLGVSRQLRAKFPVLSR